VAAEAEGVVQGYADFLLAGDVGDVVEVALGVGVVEIDGGGDQRIADGHGAGGGLYGAGCAQEVAGHRFAGADYEAVFGVVAEDGFDGFGLADVADSGRGAVSVDVIDVVVVDAGPIEGHAHAADRALAFGEGRGHVVGIGAEAVAGDLAVNGGVAFEGVLQFLDEEDAGAFAHDGYAHLVSEKRITLRIKGFRRGVFRGKGGVPPVLPPCTCASQSA